jgi:galactose mutarotase-like enzyme
VVSGRVTEAAWGAWPALRLASEVVSLLLVPALGGRIVSLVDRRTGREWLAQGAPPTAAEAERWASEPAVFSGRESFGLDECLPTVSVCPDPLDPAGPALRDHGDQWARPTRTTAAADDRALDTVWPASRWSYAFRRRLSVDEATVIADYALHNTSGVPLPVLWSAHPVLALPPGTRLVLPGVERVRVTWVAGLDLEPGEAAWPVARLADGTRVDLGRVRTDEGWAAKLYAQVAEPVRALTPDGSGLSLEWHRRVVPVLGVWLAYGGWPVGGPPTEPVALEPTMSPDDDLGSALAAGRATTIPPGRRLTWWVRLTLEP